MSETSPEQFLEQLPSTATLRVKLQEHRAQGKVLRRLIKLASERDAVSQAADKAAESK